MNECLLTLRSSVTPHPWKAVLEEKKTLDSIGF